MTTTQPIRSHEEIENLKVFSEKRDGEEIMYYLS